MSSQPQLSGQPLTSGLSPSRGHAIALVSAKGSPGVTTSAVLLAAVWPGAATLLEADPAGGDLRTLFDDPTGPPLRPDVGVVSLLTAQTAADATADGALTLHGQALPGGLSVLLGPANASQTEALRNSWPHLPDAVTRHVRTGGNAVLDVGRLADPSSMTLTLPLLRACDLTLVVTRATSSSVSHARELLTLLRQISIPTQVLLLAFPRDAVDVGRALRLSVDEVHLLPDDPASAAALSGPWTRRLDRSRLLNHARDVAGALSTHLRLPAAAPGTSTPERRADDVGTTDLTSAGTVSA